MPKQDHIEEVPLSRIRVGKRLRHQLGDIESLASSMVEDSQLQPICLTAKNELIFGFRRMEAAKLLKWKTIKAVYALHMTTIESRIRAEYKENACHKPFTPSEAVAAGKIIAERLPTPNQRKAEGGKKGGEKAGRGRPDRDGVNKTIPIRDTSKRTDNIVAKAAGMSASKYRKAEAVVNAAKENPKQFGDLQVRMDTTGKVEPAHKELQRRRDGGAADRLVRNIDVKAQRVTRIKEALQELSRLVNMRSERVSLVVIRQAVESLRDDILKLLS